MNGKVVALLLAGIISSGLIYFHPAYAHNFGGDESSTFLAKVANLKAEVQALQMDLSDSAAVDWHVDKIGEYWNSNDTKEMNERNTRLGTEIPSTLDAITSASKQPNPDVNSIKQNIDTLNGYLDEGITARIDKDKMQNATVQALTVTNILSETLESYGDAINSTVDLNDMSQMNMGSMNSSGTMSGTMQSGSSMGMPVVEMAAYTSAQMHAKAAKDYFDKNVAPLASSDVSAFVTKADDNLGKLIDAINNKKPGNDVMTIVHLNIHPSLIGAFNLPQIHMESTVPEFPIPALLVLISIIGVIAITRFSPKLR